MGPVGSQVVGIVQLVELAQPLGPGSGVDGDSNGADLFTENASVDEDPLVLVPGADLVALEACGTLTQLLQVFLSQVGTTGPAGIAVPDCAVAVGELDVAGVGVGAGGLAGEHLAVLGGGSDLAGLGGGRHGVVD